VYWYLAYIHFSWVSHFHSELSPVYTVTIIHAIHSLIDDVYCCASVSKSQYFRVLSILLLKHSVVSSFQYSRAKL
jgi:hypothetical protein